MPRKIKSKKQFKIKNIIILITLLLIFSYAIYLISSITLKKISNLSIFNIKEITCTLPAHIEKDKLFGKESLISVGKSIFSFTINEAKEEILKNNWIKDLRIRRNLPSKVEVEIKIKNPVALVSKNNKLLYIDEKGTLIDKLIPGYKNNLPIIKSSNKNYLKGIYILSKINNSKKLKAMPLSMISEIHVDSSETALIYHLKENIKYKINIDDIEQSITNAQKVFNNLKLRKEKAEFIDASLSENKVVVKLII